MTPLRRGCGFGRCVALVLLVPRLCAGRGSGRCLSFRLPILGGGNRRLTTGPQLGSSAHAEHQ